MKLEKSVKLFEQAQTLFPGGVNSPVRAFRAVGGQPHFIDHAYGVHIFDVDGNCFIDYVLSWGPLILGHAHPQVVKAVQTAAERGTSYGAPSPYEIELARLIQSFFPSMQMLRFVNSGTEATMSTLRLARAFTKRNKIIKFEGCYHGHADLLLVQAGSGVATLGLPDSPGVPPSTVQDTLSARFNDLESVETIFKQYPGEIAAVIVEPVAGNMGVVTPIEGFLPGLRQLTTDYNALLIFDEVMTGFRVHPGGAQAQYQISPDLTTLGKVIGGGLPVGAYGGRRDIMTMVAPSGQVYQAGTLSGNPLAMAAGIATLQFLLSDSNWYAKIDDAARRMEAGLLDAAKSNGISLSVGRAGSMFTVFFTNQSPRDWRTVKTCDTEKFARFFRYMLAEGIYLAPSQFEANFLSILHDETIIDKTINAAASALRVIARQE